MLTLAQVQKSSTGNIGGVNVQDPQFTSYINDACRQLINLGEWWASVQQMTGAVAGGCITWPRKIDTVLAMRIGKRPATVTNFWYHFTPVGGEFDREIRDSEWFSGWGRGMRRSVIEFSGTQCLFAGPTPANPFALQITADSPADYGKFITIYGYDVNGLEITATRADGSIQRGIQLTLSASPPNTVTRFSQVTSIAKDETTAEVRAWSFVAGSGPGSVVGIFGGGQTSPEFLFSMLPTCHPECAYCITALVKLAFEEVAQPSDPLSIGNLDAIKSMVQSIRARESGDDVLGDTYEKTAIRRLNMELNTRFPLDQIIIKDNTFNEGCYHRRIY